MQVKNRENITNIIIQAEKTTFRANGGCLLLFCAIVKVMRIKLFTVKQNQEECKDETSKTVTGHGVGGSIIVTDEPLN